MKTIVELKACPFPHEVRRGVFLEVDAIDFGYVRGACADCGCAGPLVTLESLVGATKAEKAEAARLWNTRSADAITALSEDNARLRRVVDREQDGGASFDPTSGRLGVDPILWEIRMQYEWDDRIAEEDPDWDQCMTCWKVGVSEADARKAAWDWFDQPSLPGVVRPVSIKSCRPVRYDTPTIEKEG